MKKRRTSPMQSRRKGTEWRSNVLRMLRAIYPLAELDHQLIVAERLRITCRRGTSPPFLAGFMEADQTRATGVLPACAVHVDGANRNRLPQQVVVLALTDFLKLIELWREVYDELPCPPALPADPAQVEEVPTDG